MTREEAIKCIQEEKLRYERAPWVNSCPMMEEWQTAIDICDMALSALRVQQEQESKPLNGWISVKDRLPEKNQAVLGWYKDNPFAGYTYEVVSWNGKGWVFVYAQRYVTNVTHWMPMPLAPEMGKAEE